MSVDDQQGLPKMTKGGARVFDAAFQFWSSNWAWAHTETKFTVNGPLDYSTEASNEKLGLDLKSRVKKTNSSELTWNFELSSQKALNGVIGGGITFKLNVSQFGTELGTPELLPANRGWAWGSGPKRVEARFEPAPDRVYFEPGSAMEIRAFFYKGHVPQGKRRYQLVVSAPEGTNLAGTLSERYGSGDPKDWPEDSLKWNVSPVDLSFLNAGERPAGKHGFLRVAGDQLVFEDGTAVKFWGTNLTAYALFRTSREGTRQQARRLSELGFNLVRIHHHDSSWVNPNIFGSDKAGSTRTVSEEMQKRLDWWIKCLKDEGIYVWLDLNVGRMFRREDQIDGFTEISRGGPEAESRGFNYVNASIKQAMKEFNEQYLSHKNAYTQLAYKDEPAIAVMLVTNENDVTHHFGNSMLPDKKVPMHSALFRSEADAYASKYGLPQNKVWRSWENGVPKLFLNDLEYRFHLEMIKHLRELGVKVPIVPTSTWGDAPLTSLPALTAGDIIDVHSYGEAGELEKSPLYGPNFIDWMAAAKVAGKPMTVSEWNVSRFPVRDRHTAPLFVAASARLQGWDALLEYAYAQVGLDSQGEASNWHAYNDPGLLATMPAAALLYRRGDVQESKRVLALSPTKDQLFNDAISPINSVALRTAAAKGRLVVVLPQVKELPWLQKGYMPPNATLIANPGQTQIEPEASSSMSDSGEVRRSWETGVFTINTPRSQIASGWIGGRQIGLADIDFLITTPNATVAIQSLDSNAIPQSGAILITLGARSMPKSTNQPPFYSEPVVGEIAIKARRGLKLFALSRTAETSPYKYSKSGAQPQETELTATYDGSRYYVKLDKLANYHWLMLK